MSAFLGSPSKVEDTLVRFTGGATGTGVKDATLGTGLKGATLDTGIGTNVLLGSSLGTYISSGTPSGLNSGSVVKVSFLS